MESETFGESNVGLLTGDSAVNRDAQVLIMTTEILRNILYQSVVIASSDGGLLHVDVIVLDEVHYLSDISRGTVWEEIVIYCPKEVQLICLSATVANPDELAGWIGVDKSKELNFDKLKKLCNSILRRLEIVWMLCLFLSVSAVYIFLHHMTELVASTKRPVPLTWHFSTKTALLPLLDDKGTSMNRKLSLNYLQYDESERELYRGEVSKRRKSRRRENDVPQIIDTLWHLKARDMLPAVWFIFSRKGCDASVQYLEDCRLLDECEMSEVELAFKRFRIQYPDAVRVSAVKGLRRGVAAHHAGCLPLWKSFIEELFQRDLVKVVFATETLAAGINMPARTAVISSLSKRGIDEKGHVVLVQTPYEGLEECCKVLFSGLQPLVSQFTVSYGMVLNLVAGAKVARRSSELDEIKVTRAGRTLEEARKLIEQSFGNYVGSIVMLAAKEELARIEREIETLTSEISEEAIDRKSQKLLTQPAYQEIAELQEELRFLEARVIEKGSYSLSVFSSGILWKSNLVFSISYTVFNHYFFQLSKMELERVFSLKPLLKELEDGHLPFMSLHYTDSDGVQHLVAAVCLGKVDTLNTEKLKSMVRDNDAFALKTVMENFELGDSGGEDVKSSYHVALGSDNSWYLFTEKWIRTVYRTGFPNAALTLDDALPRDIMAELLDKAEMQWQKLAVSELGGLWCMEGSLETWSWSLNVPVLSSLSEEDEVLRITYLRLSHAHILQKHSMSCNYLKHTMTQNQRNKVSRLKKRIARTEGFKEYKKIVDSAKFTEEKIRRLKVRSKRLIGRIDQIGPTGWKEFLQVSNVIHESRALDINIHVISPLGETAAAIQGENELWLAMVLQNKLLLDLKPAQLAAVCGSLVSEGIRLWPWKNNRNISMRKMPNNPGIFLSRDFLLDKEVPDFKCQVVLLVLDLKTTAVWRLVALFDSWIVVLCFVYEPSTTVLNVRLIGRTKKLTSRASGKAWTWASGLTWKEIMMDCAMDEGDLARLLRRTIDLLAQVPKLPDIYSLLQTNAKSAANVMDRPPISELAG
ncbi:hypothetical protein RND71_003071 [Anisodus tanguticus]|uniref:Helicase ATP-binding domain-containing protein n=1 Tax=Anisodus tanguticus TaxID=243964 RepID=A0AAE1SVZ4_9SOLA|nr:hypothetical protein RND71_003071 [Anisodus tanguticus]